MSRGGAGYQRNGKYFYATPRDIELKRSAKADAGYKPTIPRPESGPLEHRPKSITSSSSSKTTSTDNYGNDFSTGSATGSLGNFGDR
jgi:hypothetical protein